MGNGGGGGVWNVVVEVVAWKHSDLSVDCENKGGQMSKKVILSPREELLELRTVNRGVEESLPVCQCSFDSKTQVNEL